MLEGAQIVSRLFLDSCRKSVSEDSFSIFQIDLFAGKITSGYSSLHKRIFFFLKAKCLKQNCR